MAIVPADTPSTISTETVEDVVIAALRKIVGHTEDPSPEQASIGLEALNNMLAEWTKRGMDVGLTLPTTLTAVLAVPIEYVSGIKANLKLALCDDFNREVTPSLRLEALTGMIAIKQQLKPAYINEYF